MSTDVASIMLPVSRALMDRDRELDAMAGLHPNPGGAPAAIRGMKRGDPEPDAQTAAALVDSAGAECKRPRMDGPGGIGEVGQVSVGLPVSTSSDAGRHDLLLMHDTIIYILCILLTRGGPIFQLLHRAFIFNMLICANGGCS